MNRKFLIANWKMNPVDTKKAGEIFRGVKDRASKSNNVEVVVCPPYLHLPALRSEYKGKKIKFGGQDCFYEQTAGSYTGEISPAMLKDQEVSYVILGHSERRKLWETNKVVNSKIRAAIGQDLIVVVCIGERQRDEEGNYLGLLRSEIEKSLNGLRRSELQNIILAYEPLWAIGKTEKEAIEAEDLHKIKIFIRKVLAENYGRNTADIVPVLYGGSVNSSNIKDLIEGEVDGFLVGRSGRRPQEFNNMLEVLNKKR